MGRYGVTDNDAWQCCNSGRFHKVLGDLPQPRQYMWGIRPDSTRATLLAAKRGDLFILCSCMFRLVSPEFGPERFAMKLFKYSSYPPFYKHL